MNITLERLFWVLPVFFIISACQRVPEGLPPTELLEGEFPYIEISQLAEYPEMLGNITHFTFLDAEHFIVISNPPGQVLVYNKQGEQVRQIGNMGRGEFEFLNPAIVRASGERVFVWCSRLVKLLIFATDGTPLEEIQFQTAISDFVVWENLMLIYNPGRHTYTILKIFDLKSRAFLERNFGTVTNEHLILSTLGCAGGLTLVNHYVYFTPTDRLKVYRLNLKDFSQTFFQINDPDFVVEKVETPASEFIPSPLASSYVFSAAIVEGLFTIEDYLVLRASVGPLIFEGWTLVDYSERRNILYFLNHDLELKRKVKGLPNMRTQSCLMDASCEGKYAIIVHTEPPIYRLNRLDLAGL